MTDEEVFKIASEADTCPIHPFWLKDDVVVSSVREAVLRFARAIETEVKSKQSAQEPRAANDREPNPDSQQPPWTRLEVLHKTYVGESICEVLAECFVQITSGVTEQLKMIPVDEYGFMQGNFTVRVMWEAEEEK